MITISKRALFARRMNYLVPRTVRGTIFLFFLFMWCLAPGGVFAADSGAEFRAKDDLTVQGEEGTKNDADLEVKGVSSFAKDIFIEAGILASPYGGMGRYRNALKYSEEFDNALWGPSTLTVTANNTAAPDGAQTAELLSPDAGSTNAYVRQASGLTTASTQFTGSIWLKSATGSNVSLVLGLYNDNGSSNFATSTITVTTSWQRFFVTGTSGATPTNIYFFIGCNSSLVQGENIYAWGGQLEEASAPGVYAKTTSSTVALGRGIVSTGDFLMPSLKLSGGQITDTSGTVTVGSNLASTGNLQVTGAGPHYISQGNVGIGTTGPNQHLVVYSGGAQAASITGASGGQYLLMGNQDSLGVNNPAIIMAANGALRFGGGNDWSQATGGTMDTAMTLLDTGNVGIGTTGPSEKLDIIGNAEINGAVFVGGASDTGMKLWNDTTAQHIQSFGSKPLYINEFGNNIILNPATGYVGIGTTGPVEKLDVNGTALFRSGAYFADGMAIGSWSGNEAKIKFFNATGTQFYSDTAGTIMTVHKGGNVGIGTTVPGARLDVAGNMNMTGTYGNAGTLYSNDILSLKGQNQIILLANSAEVLRGISGKVSIGGESSPGSTLSVKGGVSVGETTDYSQAAAPAGGMIIKGYVGIGTTAPNYKLDVQTSLEASVTQFKNTYTNPTTWAGLVVTGTNNNTDMAYGANRAPSVLIQNTNGTANTYGTLGFVDAGGNSVAGINGIFQDDVNNQGSLAFFIRPSGGNGTETMRISSTGKVGIGTTAPTEALHVVGNIIATGTISGTGGAYATGSGTQNYISKWNTAAGDTIGNSIIYDNGTNVGIGTTDTGAYKFNVNGNANITGTISASGGNSGNWNTAYTHSQATSNVHGLTFTAEGSGGGLDADLLDGQHGTYYSRAASAQNSVYSLDSRNTNDEPDDRNAGLYVDFKANSTNGLNDGGTYNGVLTFRSYGSTGDLTGGNPMQIGYTANGNLWTRMGTAATTWGTWYKLWNQNNDGSSSGLDADLLDGHDTSYFQTTLTNPVTGTGVTNKLAKFTGSSAIGDSQIFDNGTNVGIGTTTPGSALHVFNASNPQVLLEETNGNKLSLLQQSAWNSNIYAGAYYNGTNDVYGASTRAPFKMLFQHDTQNIAYISFSSAPDGTAGNTITWSELMRIKQDGNVGIGTADPGAYKLNVNGNTNITGTLTATGTINGQTIGASSALNALTVGGGYGSSGITMDASGNLQVDGNIYLKGTVWKEDLQQLLVKNNAIRLNSGGSSQDAKIEVEGTGATTLTTIQWNNAASNWSIDKGLNITSGNVGIGTTGPSTTLDVVKASGPQAKFTNGTYSGAGSSGSIQIGDATISKTYGNGWIWGSGLQPDSDNARYLGTTGASWGSLTVGNLTASTINSVTVLTNGNVGIGTTNPGALLQVSKNQNADTQLDVANTTDGTGSRSYLSLTGNGGITFLESVAPSNSSLTAWANSSVLTTSYPSLWISNYTASGVIKFQTGGIAASNERMRIDSTGNVGIGTAAPTEALHVVGNITATGTISGIGGAYATGSGTQNYISKWSNAAGDTIGNSIIYDNGTNVGIGTTSPAYLLDIAKGSGGGSAYLRISSVDNNGYLLFGATGSSINRIYSRTNTDTAAAFRIQQGSTDVFNIDTSGNVGIGTTGPIALLHTKGTNPELRIQRVFNNQTSTLRFQNTEDSNNMWIYQPQSLNDIRVAFNSLDLVTIKSAGNVGIGTTAPTAPLTLANGPLQITGIGTPTSGGGLELEGSLATGGEVLAYNRTTPGYLPLMLRGSYAVLESNGTEVLRATSGNVGIGTTAPVAKLEINGGAGSTDGLKIASLGTASKGIDLSASGLSTGGVNDNDYLIYFSDTEKWQHVGGAPNGYMGIWTHYYYTDQYYGANNNNLYLSAVGASYFNAGNVGIGTATPSAKLSVISSQSSATVGYFKGAASQTANLFEIRDSADSGVLIADSSGKVGIGTTSPEAKLDVANGTLRVGTAGDVNIAHDLYFEDTTSSAIKSYGPLTIQSGNPNSNYNLVLKGTGTGKVYVDDDLEITGTTTFPSGLTVASGNITASSGNISASAGSGTFGTLTVTGATNLVTTSGNVGIGTTAPVAKLGFATATTAAGGIDFGGDTNLYRSTANQLKTDDTLWVVGDLEVSGNFDTRSNLQLLNKASSGWLAWATRNTAGSEAVYNLSNIGTLTAAGNVGIGTTAPGYKLDVSGDMRIPYQSNLYAINSIGNVNNLATLDSGTFGIASGIENIDVYGGSGANGFNIGSTGNGISGYTNILTFNTNSGEKVRIDSTGNVGIGTTVPGGKLHIYEESDNAATGISAYTGGLTIQNNTTVVGAYSALRFKTEANDYIYAKAKMNADNDADLIFGKYNSNVGGAGTDWLTIKNGGNVGIGTAAPVAKLEIASGQIFAPVGSASSPTYSFSADPDTGMYAVANDTIRFAVNGLLAGYVTTPASGGWFFDSQIRVSQGTAANPSIRFNGDSSNTGFYYPTANNIGFVSNGAEKMRLDANGYLGIGTTAPGNNLHLYSSTAWEPQVMIENINADNTAPQIFFKKNSSTPANDDYLGAMVWYGKDSAGGLYTNWGRIIVQAANVVDGSETGRMSLGTGVNGSGAPVDTLTIYNGNVGIGTTGPAEKFQVFSASIPQYGGVASIINRSAVTNAVEGVLTLVKNTSGTAANGMGARLQFGLQDAGGSGINTNFIDSVWEDASAVNRYARLDFYAAKNNGQSLAMSINKDGKVGIGTTAPTEALHVVGNITATGTISGIGGAYATGSGTQNYISKWSTVAGDTIGNSIIYDNGTNVGIGTTGPVAKLEIGSGQIFVPNGTISAPSYSFTSDSNTGIFLQGADTLGLVLGGVELVRYTTTSGVTQRLLHDTGGITFGVSSDVNLYRGGANQLKTDDALVVAGTGDTTIAGNVGIGTTDPGVYKLNVATGPVYLGDSYIVFGGSGSLSNGASGYTVNNAWTVNDVFSGTKDILTVADDSSNPLTTGNLQVWKDSNGVVVDVVDKAGKVGIGTSVPTAKLEVVGPLKVTSAGDTGVAQDLIMTNIDSSTIKSYGPMTIQSGGSNDNFNLVLKGSGTGKVLVDGNFSATGNIELGDAVADTVKITGTVIGASPALIVDQASADVIAVFKDSGTSVMTIADGGNVGIGTASPTSGLDVQTTYPQLTLGNVAGTQSGAMRLRRGGDGGVQGKVGWSAAGDGNTFEVGIINGGGSSLKLTSGAASNSYITFEQNNLEKMRIDTTGYVGIGTTTPGTHLHVYDGASGGTPLVTTGMTLEDNASNYLQFLVPAGNYESAILFGDSGDNNIGALSYNHNTDSMFFRVNDGTQMTINNGNVGIGTTSPGVRLEIAAPTAGESFKVTSKANEWAARIVGNSTAGQSYGQVVTAGTNSSDKAFEIYNQSAGTSYLQVRGDGQIYMNGNVGVGTTGPVNKLQIGTATDAGSGYGLSVTGAGNLGVIDSSGGFFVQNGTTTYGNGYAGTYSAVDFSLKTNNIVRLTIDAGVGNVGIGTAAPSAKLDVRDGDVFLSDADVAHGITGYSLTTNTYGGLQIDSATDGGLRVWGIGDTLGQRGLVNLGVLGNADPTDTVAAITLAAGKKNAAGIQAIGNSETALVVENWGSPLVTVLGSGNVGIGTAAPGNYKLNINGPVNVTGSLDVSGTINSAGTTAFNALTVGGGYGSSGITMDANGNLQVDGNIYLKGTVWKEDLQQLLVKNNAIRLNSGGSSQDAKIEVEGTGATTLTTIQWNNAASNWSIDKGLNITSGNVGIGTTAPGVPLYVKTTGADAILMKTEIGTSGYYTEWQGAGGFKVHRAYGTGGDLGISIVNDDNLAWSGAGGGISLQTTPDTQANLATRVRIMPSGNVGIGTAAPGAALDVVGAIRSSNGLTVSGGSVSLPANSITDAMVSDTLTASNLVAGSGVVDSTEIVDGAIVNADINASAGIVDTKLATISTAGKVSDSALSSTVTKLGQTIESSEIADGTIVNTDLASGSFSNITSVGTLGSLNVSGVTNLNSDVVMKGNSIGNAGTTTSYWIRLAKLRVTAMYQDETSTILIYDKDGGGTITTGTMYGEIFFRIRQTLAMTGNPPQVMLELRNNKNVLPSHFKAVLVTDSGAEKIVELWYNTAVSYAGIYARTLYAASTDTNYYQLYSGQTSQASLPAGTQTSCNVYNTAHLLVSNYTNTALYADAVTGRVGIGTAAPDQALHVVGNITATGTISGVGGTYASGSGTQNYISKWNNAAGTALGNSVIYDNGTNVGIGTTAPVGVLDVRGGNTVGTGVFIGSTGANVGNGIRIMGSATNGGTSSIYTDHWVTEGALSLGTYANRANQLFLATSGSIGIGTASPNAKLSIYQAGGGTGTNNALHLTAGNNLSYSGNNQIVFSYDNTYQYNHAIKTRHNSGAATGNDIDFYVWKYGTDAIGAIGTQHVMTLDGNGYVGIGTVSPAAKLDVVYDSNKRAYIAPTSTGSYIGMDTNTENFLNFYNTGLTSGVRQWRIGTRTSAGDKLVIDRLNDAGSSITSTPFVLDNAGNVGIGLTTPISRLHVVGEMRHTGTMISQGANYANAWMQFDQDVNGNSLILGSGGLTSLGSGESATVVKGNIAASNETLYLSSDNDVKFVTSMQNGWATRVDAMTIATNGNVGIGTAEPIAKLAVDGNIRSVTTGSNTIYYRFIQAPDSNLHLDTSSSGAGLYLNHYNNGNIYFGTNGSWMFVKNDGNVGIGTTGPTERLQVYPNTDVSADIGRAHIGYANDASWGDNAIFSHYDHDSITNLALAQLTSGSVRINAPTGQSITFWSNMGSERMRIASDGNVGIGTTAPGAKLNVKDGTNYPTFTGTQHGNVLIEGDWATGNFTTIGFTSENNPTFYYSAIGQKQTADGTELHFGTSNSFGSGVTNTAMVINHNGNIGVGTAVPTEKLEVTGNIKLTGRIRQGSMGDVAEMMALSPMVLDSLPRNFGGSLEQYSSSGVSIANGVEKLYAMPQPNDVVMIDRNGGIRLSDAPNSTQVIGVVSVNPAQILREELPNSVPVALSGTVPCRATTENGPIYPGDMLTSSSKPGYAMKADPPKMGSIIGKAMEALEEGEGEIMVFVTRQ